jgi:CRP/FNR family transcriptional regulator, nitrogen fixation regulation protein
MLAAGRPIEQPPGASSRASAQPTIPDALSLLEQFGSTSMVQREREIYGHGESADCCWQVLSGCVRMVRVMEDGRRHVGEFLLPGDFFGLEDVGFYECAAEAITNVILRRYPRRLVEALANRHSGLASRLRALTQAKLRSAGDRLLLLGRLSAMEKVASFVLEMDQRLAMPGRHACDFPMSRYDIADYLGLTIETVCRHFAQLKRDGNRSRIGVDRIAA